MVHNSVRQGYTLIEMAIVLLIIGLVTGAVMVGKDLIEAAKVRSQVSQLEKLSAAVNAFKGKYDDLPGDMLLAKAAQLGLASNGVLCNPNRDGTFNGRTSCDPSYGPEYGFIYSTEHLIFFPQLSSAKLIEGQYQFTSGTGTIGHYAPTLKLSDQAGPFPVTVPDFGGNWFMLNAMSFASGSCGWLTQCFPATALTPAQAYLIDAKMDDGKPNSGIVRASKIVCRNSDEILVNDDNSASSDCSGLSTTTIGCTVAGSRYDLTTTSTACRIAAKMQ